MKYLNIVLTFLILCSCVSAERLKPTEQIETFLKNLKDSGPRSAVDKLIEGTVLKKQKGMQVEAIIPQFEAAINIYGDVKRMEFVDEKKYGESFSRYRFITYHTSGVPMFWQFMFFKGNDGWEIYIFRFNDQFDAVFKDA